MGPNFSQIVFIAVSAIPQPFTMAVNGYKCDWFWSILVSPAALSSLIFFEHQGNDLLRAKGVDTGHHLTSQPTVI